MELFEVVELLKQKNNTIIERDNAIMRIVRVVQKHGRKLRATAAGRAFLKDFNSIFSEVKNA